MADKLMMTRRAMLRAALAATGAIAAAAPLAGCSQTPVESGSAVQAGSAERESRLTFGMQEPLCIDPFDAVDAAGVQVCFQLFDTLTRYDYEYGVMTCLAAESYVASEDQTEFTFTLRDATFHNGDPVRAADFKRAWERLVDPSSAAAAVHGGVSSAAFMLALVDGYDALAHGEASELAGVSCPDDRTLTVRLTAPYADFPFIVAHPCLAPVPAAAESDAASYARMPIGNGPFMMAASWGEGADGIDLARFEGYVGSVTTVDTVHFAFYESVNDAYRAYESGDLTVAPCPIESADANAASWKSSDDERLRLTADRHTVLGTDLTVSYLVCNTAATKLGDADVRRAISMAIDRDAISKQVFRDARMPAYGIVCPDIPGYREDAWGYTEHDPSAASDLLDERYPRDSDGMRDISLTLVYSPDSGHENAMEGIAEDLKEIGIDCELEEVPLRDLYVRLRSGSFQLGRVDWTADIASMDNVLFPLFDSASIESFNFSRYANQQFDELIGQARAAATEAERLRLYQDAEDLVAADMPVIPYLFGAHAFSGTRRVERLHIDPEGFAHLGEAELAE